MSRIRPPMCRPDSFSSTLSKMSVTSCFDFSLEFIFQPRYRMLSELITYEMGNVLPSICMGKNFLCGVEDSSTIIDGMGLENLLICIICVFFMFMRRPSHPKMSEQDCR